jgi:alanyl-tRNA synthetase
VESLQDEVADLKKELTRLRTQAALSSFVSHLDNVRAKDVNAGAGGPIQMDTLRTLPISSAKYPKNGVALLTSNGTVISVVTEDLVKRGLKAGDLITSIGGRGGGRPNLAQGSLPDPALSNDAIDKLTRAVEEN